MAALDRHVIERLPLNEALAQFLIDETGRPIGKAKVPTQPGDDQTVADVPYAILHALPGGTLWGPPLSYAEDSGGLHYQTTCVGNREDQAQWMSDQIRRAITGLNDDGSYAADLVVPGMGVMLRESNGPPGGPTQMGSIWNVVDAYVIWVTVA